MSTVEQQGLLPQPQEFVPADREHAAVRVAAEPPGVWTVIGISIGATIGTVAVICFAVWIFLRVRDRFFPSHAPPPPPQLPPHLPQLPPVPLQLPPPNVLQWLLQNGGGGGSDGSSVEVEVSADEGRESVGSCSFTGGGATACGEGSGMGTA